MQPADTEEPRRQASSLPNTHSAPAIVLRTPGGPGPDGPHSDVENVGLTKTESFRLTPAQTQVVARDFRSVCSFLTGDLLPVIEYLIGSLCYAAGSVFFYPALHEWYNVGPALFVVGVGFFLLSGLTGLIHITKEVVYSLRAAEPMTFWLINTVIAEALFYAGKALFLVGSVLFFNLQDFPSIHQPHAGAWCYIVGCVVFFTAVSMKFNTTLKELDLFQPLEVRVMSCWIAICALVGTVIYFVCTFPYLVDMTDAADQLFIERFGSAQFLLGSLFFVAAAVINIRYTTKFVIMKVEADRAPPPPPDAAGPLRSREGSAASIAVSVDHAPQGPRNARVSRTNTCPDLPHTFASARLRHTDQDRLVLERVAGVNSVIF